MPSVVLIPMHALRQCMHCGNAGALLPGTVHRTNVPAAQYSAPTQDSSKTA
eukprot:COSAG01_NODE_32361_length_582_cov_6.421439_1_plen_50_part_10